MYSSEKQAQAKLESMKQARLQRLLDDAAELQSNGQLKQLPLQPGQVRPPTRELRIKTPQ